MSIFGVSVLESAAAGASNNGIEKDGNLILVSHLPNTMTSKVFNVVIYRVGLRRRPSIYYTGCFFSHWYPPKKLKYGKPT